jgi:UDP-2-acetamido-2,6-beta-L-arabino-hexul-4-ose reductase
MKILVTGAAGFIGRNLCIQLARIDGWQVIPFDMSNDVEYLYTAIGEAEAVVHLAGINRPNDTSEFVSGNLGLTSDIAEYLERIGHMIPVIFASSIQAELDNDYGRSKRAAEERLKLYAERTGSCVRIFRFANVFGKWCKPNYNSAVTTFCHNVAHGLPIRINDPDTPLRLIYIDDVVAAIIRELELHSISRGFSFANAKPVYETTVGAVADIIHILHDGRLSGLLPDFSDPLIKKLNSTYLSYLEPQDIPLPANMKRDGRGWLFELVKSIQGGQLFVSTTLPGKIRGNHFHDTKVEKFCVVSGQARISLRRVDGTTRLDFEVDGETVQIIDIPPGYTHSILNTGNENCVTIFWANEIFDPAKSDTYYAEV